MDFADLNDQLEREFSCSCPDAEIRYLLCANDVKQWKRQCPRCGRCGNPLPRLTLTVTQMLHAAPVDPALRETWYQRRRERHEELCAAAREAARAEQAAEYAEYLQSAVWRARRDLRLDFDAHRCQAQLPGCAGRATQVHHLTYQHVGQEPLFDLASVCRNCHEGLHGLRGGD